MTVASNPSTDSSKHMQIPNKLSTTSVDTPKPPFTHAGFFDLQKVAGSISQALETTIFTLLPDSSSTIMQQVDYPIVKKINRKSKIENTHVINQIDFISL
jgi:hypothetical protein